MKKSTQEIVRRTRGWGNGEGGNDTIDGGAVRFEWKDYEAANDMEGRIVA